MATPKPRLDGPARLGPHPLPMSTIKSICVYCASGPGNNPAFMDAARQLGRILAENGIRLVYGGGSVGLMGALEELVEQLTWAQLGRHKKPILILNTANFWEPLCQLLDQMERLDFIRAGLPVKLLVAERVEDILPKLFEAVRSVPEMEKEMTSVTAERM